LNNGAPRQRSNFGVFVWDTTNRTGICDSARTIALVGILQLAKAHPQGFVGSIAHSVHGAWFAANVDILFQDYAPLGTFNPIEPQMLMRHFGVALQQAKDYFNQEHSSKQSGAGKEEIPA
jgi:hypothetical protein